MKHKYVRHSELGFILWPDTDKMWHSHIGHYMLRAGGEIVSAGFVDFDGEAVCYGESESLKLKSRPEDSELLTQQLGMRMHDAPQDAPLDRKAKKP